MIKEKFLKTKLFFFMKINKTSTSTDSGFVIVSFLLFAIYFFLFIFYLFLFSIFSGLLLFLFIQLNEAQLVTAASSAASFLYSAHTAHTAHSFVSNSCCNNSFWCLFFFLLFSVFCLIFDPKQRFLLIRCQNLTL